MNETQTIPKPVPITPDPSRIPDELKENCRFCCWKYELVRDKWTKVPYNPRNGYKASTTDPQTFKDFKSAQTILSHYDGLGVLMSAPYAGIDIDHCFVDDGTLSEMAGDIIAIMHSYTEKSPSGKGVRILFKVPDGYKYDSEKYRIINHDLGPTEVHVGGSENRFLTLTGDVLLDEKIGDRSEELQTMIDKYMMRPEPKNKNTAPPEPVDLDDQEIIDKANDSDSTFFELWHGDISGYDNDHSVADLALCEKLAFWTGRDPERIDRMFRSSGLMRDKWNRDDYRNKTISRACDYCKDVYTPSEYDDAVAQFDRDHPEGMQKIKGEEAKHTDTPPTQKSVSQTGTSSASGEDAPGQKSDSETGGETRDTTPAQESSDPQFVVYSVRDYINDKQFEGDIEYFKKYKDRKTGIYSIDENLTLYPGMGAIGGASSLGKTTFCVNLADNLITQGETVLYFSFEQEPIELVTKSLARRLGQIDPKSPIRNIGIKNGETNDALERVKKEYARDVGDRFNIVRCNFRTTATSICDYIKRFIQTTGVRPTVFIDYLQLVAPPDGWKGDTRGAIDDNIKLFKTLQLQEELLLILVSNFNRSGYDSPVSYSDFKETGMIEYTCDYLWGLQLEILDHREYYVAQGAGANGKDRLTTPQEKDDYIDRAIAEYPKKVQFVSLKSRNGKQRYKCNLNYYMDFDYFLDPTDPAILKERNPF